MLRFVANCRSTTRHWTPLTFEYRKRLVNHPSLGIGMGGMLEG